MPQDSEKKIVAGMLRILQIANYKKLYIKYKNPDQS